MTTLGPAIGWYDPATGKVHSLDHYKPEHSNDLDSHKSGWRLAFAPDVPASALPRCEYCDGSGDVHRADGEWLGTCTCTAAPVLSPAAEAAARAFGAGLDPLALEQPSEVS